MAAALLVATIAVTGDAAVSVIKSDGSRVNGFAAREDGERIIVDIYRGFQLPVPRVEARIERFGDPLATEREDLARARAALPSGDVAATVALARRAAEQGLTIAAAGLLHECGTQVPAVRAAVTQLWDVPVVEDVEAARAAALAWLATPDNDDLRQRVLAHDHIPAALLPRLRRELWEAFAAGPTLAEGDGRIEHPRFTGQVHVERWARDAAARRAPGPWPLVLSLHGGGKNNGHWRNFGPQARGLFARHLDRFVLLAPTVLEKKYAEWAGNPLEEVFVARALDACKRGFSIDTDRVFVVGYSMGGYGAWHIGGHRADVFAGIVSGAGGILIGTARGETWGWGIIGNLRHTAIAFCHGGKDKPAPPWSDRTADRILTALAGAHPQRYAHHFGFFPKAGHGLPGKAMREAVAFVAKRVRDPLPRDLTWEPKRRFNRMFAWLMVDEPRCFTRIDARFIEDDVIELDLIGIDGGLSILLNEDMVDLDRPIEVRCGGRRVFHGKARPSLVALAGSIRERFDPQLVFTHRIRL